VTARRADTFLALDLRLATCSHSVETGSVCAAESRSARAGTAVSMPAATQVPEMIAAIHSFRKIEFPKAAQVDEVRRSPLRRMNHRIVFAHELLLTFFR